MLKQNCAKPHKTLRPSKVVLAIAALWIFSRLTPAIAGADVDGKALFEKRCAGCHALEADHEGPRLKGVVGRRAGTVQTFDYSKALQSAKFTWDVALLEKWLMDPESLAPGTDMSFRVPKPEERTAIIEYLKSLKP